MSGCARGVSGCVRLWQAASISSESICIFILPRALERNLSVSRKIGTPLWSVFALVAELDNGPLAAIDSLPGAHFVGTPCGSADALSVLEFRSLTGPVAVSALLALWSVAGSRSGCAIALIYHNSYYTRSVCRLFFFA